MAEEYRTIIPPVRPSFDRATIYRDHMIVTFKLKDADGAVHGERAVTVKADTQDPVHAAFAAALEALSEQTKARVTK